MQNSLNTPNLKSFISAFLLLILIPCPQAAPLNSLLKAIEDFHEEHRNLSLITVSQRESLARLYQKLGNYYAQSGESLHSIGALRKGRALLPSLPSVDLKIGIVYARLGRLEQARKFLLGFYQSSPESTQSFECKQKLFSVLVQMGERSAKISLWDKAVRYFHEAMEFSSSARHTLDLVDKIQSAYFKQGTFHYSQKHYLEAARNFLKALSKNTRESLRAKIERIAGHLFLNTGKHFEEIGRVDEARPYYEAVEKHFQSKKVVTYAKKRLQSLEESLSADAANVPEWLGADLPME